MKEGVLVYTFTKTQRPGKSVCIQSYVLSMKQNLGYVPTNQPNVTGAIK